MKATIVASTTLIPPQGLSYEADFFRPEVSAMARTKAVNLDRADLLRWQTNVQSIDDALISGINAMSRDQLSKLVVRRSPPLIKVQLGQSGHMLVPVDSSNLTAPKRSRRRRAVGVPDAIETGSSYLIDIHAKI